MKSDIQIAQEAKMEPIVKIAEKLNLGEDDIELYGKYKCKISLDMLNNNKDKKDGKGHRGRGGEKGCFIA